MRSLLSNKIFRDELQSLYQKKDLSYSQVREAAMETMGRLIREMETGLCHSPVIAEQMETLAGILEEYDAPESEKAEQVLMRERLWQKDFCLAAYQLGKCWRDGWGEICGLMWQNFDEKAGTMKTIRSVNVQRPGSWRSARRRPARAGGPSACRPAPPTTG